MFANDIGMNQIEEINIVRNGGNYGWMAREGHWENGRWRGGAPGELGALSELYPLPDDILDGRRKDGFTYPVAIYDHDEGRGDHGRVRVSRPDRCAARQVCLWRHSWAAASLSRTLPR